MTTNNFKALIIEVFGPRQLFFCSHSPPGANAVLWSAGLALNLQSLVQYRPGAVEAQVTKVFILPFEVADK